MPRKHEPRSPSSPHSGMGGRPLAPHVLQAVSGAFQAKPAPGGFRAVAPHVQRAVGQLVQAKVGPAAHLRAVVSAAQAKGIGATSTTRQPAAHVAAVVTPARRAAFELPPAVAAHRARRSFAVQRMLGTGEMGFDELKVPTGYGSVSLKATVNGYSVGDAWSKSYTFAEDTEHAEDACVDFVEHCAFWIGQGKYPPNPSDTLKAVIDSMAKNAKMHLVITELTASPCSTKRGTCQKRNTTGCTERLIGLVGMLKELGYKSISISVSADHYYQPQGVEGAKKRSESAKGDLEAAGITVTIG